MTFETKKLGDLGEEVAIKHLKKQGYKILDKNFRYKGYGEIDIIAKKSEVISFIEVKTRTKSNNFYTPEDNITHFKQKQLIKLAKIYLAKNPPAGGNDIPWQIDIIAIEINPFTKEIINLRHIEQAIQDFY